MTTIDLSRQDIPPRPGRFDPLTCFYCAGDIVDASVRVSGSTAVIRVHVRCCEELGLELLRAAEQRRRLNRPGLAAIA
jgi:hypothetical protein